MDTSCLDDDQNVYVSAMRAQILTTRMGIFVGGASSVTGSTWRSLQFHGLFVHIWNLYFTFADARYWVGLLRLDIAMVRSECSCISDKHIYCYNTCCFFPRSIYDICLWKSLVAFFFHLCAARWCMLVDFYELVCYSSCKEWSRRGRICWSGSWIFFEKKSGAWIWRRHKVAINL